MMRTKKERWVLLFVDNWCMQKWLGGKQSEAGARPQGDAATRMTELSGGCTHYEDAKRTAAKAMR